MNPKTIIIIAVGVALAVGGGFLLGQQKQAKDVQNLEALVNLTFPPPPEQIYVLSGTVKGVYGATINLEIDDPDDYLPHPDGSLRQKETRFANVSGNTAYTLIDYTKIDNQGNPIRSPIQLTDIKTNDIVTVRSEQNIKDAQKFDVVAVEVVKY